MQFRFVAERKTEPREFALRRRRRLTPAQGWSAATTLGSHQEEFLTLKGLGSWRTLTGFQFIVGLQTPGLSLRSNPGLKLANAFGV